MQKYQFLATKINIYDEISHLCEKPEVVRLNRYIPVRISAPTPVHSCSGNVSMFSRHTIVANQQLHRIKPWFVLQKNIYRVISQFIAFYQNLRSI